MTEAYLIKALSPWDVLAGVYQLGCVVKIKLVDKLDSHIAEQICFLSPLSVTLQLGHYDPLTHSFPNTKITRIEEKYIPFEQQYVFYSKTKKNKNNEAI